MSLPVLATPPLIGRAAELVRLMERFDAAAEGRSQALFLFGEGGVGKTRLITVAADRAAKRGWTVAMGRAYPVETGVPYALFADALLPVVSAIEPARLSLLTRGAMGEFSGLFPGLPGLSDSPAATSGVAVADPVDAKARLLWHFTQFLQRVAAKQPLAIVLENLQWADASSLELFHFVARQIGPAKVALIGTYNDAERESNPVLRVTEQSLLRLGAASVERLEPLREPEVTQLVCEMFAADETTVGRFPARLYAWTRGNPFFLEETLKSLVERGALYERDGRWFGWEMETLELPATIREAIALRLDRLSPDARLVANLAAVIGTRVSYDALLGVVQIPEPALVSAMEELCGARVLEERMFTGGVEYDFAHPLLQQVLYGSLGHARARMLHATVAEALEARYGDRAVAYSGELAFHFVRAHARTLDPKAVRYLTAAGLSALDKYANREAAEYLSAALEHLDRAESVDARERLDVLIALARARQRLGDYDPALQLWDRALGEATAAQAARSEVAGIRLRMGLASYWSGRYDSALEHYAAALEIVGPESEDPVAVRVHLARGSSLQDLGRFDDAGSEVRSALAVAERIGDPVMLARVHRALLLMYAWSGSAEQAREHGERALELARESGQPQLLWSAHWGMALLGGLTTDTAVMAPHVAAAERLAEDLGSPLLPLWTAELAIQYASGVGDWETGIATGERTIALARALGQRILLPRLLVWTGLIYLERGETSHAREMFDEAWRISGAGGALDRPVDVPTVVPVYLGMASFHLAAGSFRDAVTVGETGLALADRAGHAVWAVQWLLPLVMEARLRARDFEEAAAHARRLRVDADRLGHKLGRACATACEGLLFLHYTKDDAAAARTLRDAAEQLETIPYPYMAARLRKELGRALRQAGDPDAGVRELRRAHDVFVRLGAATELGLTRDALRAAGVRPPVKPSPAGVAGLTGRELEIARMVALRKANKEIAGALGISARTVSTHLSNIFTKLGVDSRGALADYVRDKGLLET